MTEKVVEAQDLDVLYASSGLTLGKTPNGMEVYARYEVPPAGEVILNVLDFKFIMNLLEENHICFGVMEDAVKAFVEDPPDEQFVLVAQGKPPTPGEPAKIVYVIDEKDQSLSPKLTEDGKVDLKDLNINLNVRQNEVLARKIPPTPGKPGHTVTGDEIPPPKSKDVPMPKGKNTEVSPNGLELFATIDGTVSRTTKRISVITVYTVKGDVDYSTGNINFVGSVEIGGNVLSGFKVEAQDDVIVNGIVEGATIIAGGNVLIRRGVQGNEKADIQAGGSIHARFVNSAKLYAREDIIITGPAMHSQLKAGHRILLQGRKGVLNGGRALASESIEADSIGSEAGVATTVEVGINPELDERYRKVQEELKEDRSSLRKIDQVIEALKKIKAAATKLPPDREKTLMESIKTQFTLKATVKKLEREFTEIESELQKKKLGNIKVNGTIYPGTTIRIRRSASKIDKPMKHVNLHVEGSEIVSS